MKKDFHQLSVYFPIAWLIAIKFFMKMDNYKKIKSICFHQTQISSSETDQDTVIFQRFQTDHTVPKILTVDCKMSLVMRKPDFCICENKDADQLRGNREADQRLCFRCTDSTIPLLPKSKISSF